MTRPIYILQLLSQIPSGNKVRPTNLNVQGAERKVVVILRRAGRDRLEDFAKEVDITVDKGDVGGLTRKRRMSDRGDTDTWTSKKRVSVPMRILVSLTEFIFSKERNKLPH